MLACTHCTQTKRKCSKQKPACRRCVEKGLVCRYPAPRVAPPFDIVFSDNGEYTTIRNGDASSKAVVPMHTSLSVDDDPAQARQLLEPWFLVPSSWNIDARAVMDSQVYFGDGALTYFIDTVRGWLRQWVTEGSNPFVHACLYKLGLPEPIQDAFTAIAAYNSKTPKTERLVLQIIEQRANQLVEQQSIYTDDVAVIMLDTVAHLTRTQALLVYCIIGLFDGDVHARGHAENQIEMLTTWARQLWQSARLLAASTGVPSLVPPNSSDTHGFPALCLQADGTVPSVWHAWLLSESIRRTYITATLVAAAFLTLKQGWAPCHGGVLFTAGSGQWKAESAYAWWQRMTTCLVQPLQCVRAYDVLAAHQPSEIDEFTTAIMVISYGLEQVNEWKDRNIPPKT